MNERLMQLYDRAFRFWWDAYDRDDKISQAAWQRRMLFYKRQLFPEEGKTI